MMLSWQRLKTVSIHTHVRIATLAIFITPRVQTFQFTHMYVLLQRYAVTMTITDLAAIKSLTSLKVTTNC